MLLSPKLLTWPLLTPWELSQHAFSFEGDAGEVHLHLHLHANWKIKIKIAQ